MLTLILTGAIIFSGISGDGGAVPGKPGGIEFFGSRARSELNLVEIKFQQLQSALESQQAAKEAVDAFRKTIEAVKTIQLKERLKVLLNDSKDMYDDALEVRREQAAAVEAVLREIRADVGVEGSLIYTSAIPLGEKRK